MQIRKSINLSQMLFSLTIVALTLAVVVPASAQVATQGLVIDRTATRLNPVAGQPIYTNALHNLDIDSSGKLLAAGQGTGRVFVWDLETRELKHQFQAHEDWAFSVKFSNDSQRLVTGGGDNQVSIWNLDSIDNPTVNRIRHTGDVHSVLFSPDEKLIYSGGDDMTPFIEDVTADSYQAMEKHPRQITAMALSSKGDRLVTAARDGKVRVFDTESHELLQTIDAHEKDCLSVRFIPGTNQIITGGYDKTAAIFSIGMGYQVARFAKQEGAVVCVDVSTDGTKAASIDHKNLAIYSVERPGDEPRNMVPELASDEQLSFVRFHPTEDQIFLTTTLGRVLVIDVETKKVVHVLAVPEESKEEEQTDQSAADSDQETESSDSSDKNEDSDKNDDSDKNESR